MDVRNIFRGLDLIDKVPDELWTEVPDIGGNYSKINYWGNLILGSDS